MNRTGRAVVILAIGAMVMRLVVSGGFGWFVQQHMRIPLLIASGFLLTFGVVELISGTREERRDPSSMRRAMAPVVGWLLALPLVVLVAVAPTGLGAAAADRLDPITPTDAGDDFEPLGDNDPVSIGVLDFVTRAYWDERRSLEGRRVELEGLVVDDDAGSFRLTRFVVSCCAADGIPVQVVVHHQEPTLADDTWVRVTGIWRPWTVDDPDDLPDGSLPELDAVEIEIVPDPPDSAYESPY